MNPGQALMAIFERLHATYGPLGWWPAESPFEVCIGAILTQNTAWTNVEKAIANLRAADMLAPHQVQACTVAELAELIRPSGFFTIKSRRLKSFVDWLYRNHGGSIDRMFSGDWQELRGELLQVHGVGPETCDSILLYAGQKPTFVVDAYTRRLFHRLGLLPASAGYEATRVLFMAHLAPEVALYNEYHALIVQHCKIYCRTRPRCPDCPLMPACPTGNPSLSRQVE